ncbi:MAG TPA: hypothetical protein VH117_06770 [Edaphobacter sp.]|nr:hypothetical protein [Edaphobacter sp.]
MRRKTVDNLILSLNSWENGLARLGECIVQFQRIEDCLSMTISGLIGRTRQIGSIVTSEMSYRTRISVFSALFQYHLHCEVLPEDIVDLTKRLHWAEEQRNILVHSLWDLNEKQPGLIVRKKKAIRKKVFTVTVETLTPDDLDDLNRLFEGIITDLDYLTSQYLPKIKI